MKPYQRRPTRRNWALRPRQCPRFLPPSLSPRRDRQKTESDIVCFSCFFFYILFDRVVSSYNYDTTETIWESKRKAVDHFRQPKQAKKVDDNGLIGYKVGARALQEDGEAFVSFISPSGSNEDGWNIKKRKEYKNGEIEIRQ